MLIAWCSIVEHDLPIISISASKNNYTSRGIKQNNTFNVNTLSLEIVKPTNSIGIKSRADIVKFDLFNVIYGDLETTPMVKDSPLSLECELVHTLKLDIKHEILIGEIKKAYAVDDIVKNIILNIKKLNRFIFSMNDNN